jgi:glycosyltransferase involved in cell wall biosynthesis
MGGTMRPVQIWGVAMVRNEADIIELTVRTMISQGVDHVLVADNMSTDDTRAILDRLAVELPVTVVHEPDRAFRQSDKMTDLASQAGVAGATWIIPFDGDEIWRGTRGTIREAITQTTATILGAPMYDHYPRPTLRRGTVVERMPWNRNINIAKVAFSWQPGAVITQGNHNVEGVAGEPKFGVLLVDHYPHRSFKQTLMKRRQGAEGVRLWDAPREISEYWRIGEQSALRIWLYWWAHRLYPKLRRRQRTE